MTTRLPSMRSAKRAWRVLAKESLVHALHRRHAVDVLPNVIINGRNARSSYGKGSYWYQHPHHYAFSGKMSQARGSHYLKFGAEYRYHVGIGIFPNLMNFNFYPDTTA